MASVVGFKKDAAHGTLSSRERKGDRATGEKDVEKKRGATERAIVSGGEHEEICVLDVLFRGIARIPPHNISSNIFVTLALQ